MKSQTALRFASLFAANLAASLHVASVLNRGNGQAKSLKMNSDEKQFSRHRAG